MNNYSKDQSVSSEVAPQDQTFDEWVGECFDNERYQGLDSQSTTIIQSQNQSGSEDSGSEKHLSDDEQFIVESEPLIPEGQYTFRYLSHRTYSPKGSGKLEIRFSVAEGEHAGKILKAYYRVNLRGEQGKFTLNRQGEYYEQMCDLFPELIKGRTDRFSPRRLRGKLVIGEVVTVKSKWNGDARKAHTQYSKVGRLVTLG